MTLGVKMLNVLVVDDDQALRLTVKSCLENHFAVDEAFDGINAMEKILSGAKKYDLVLLDVDMPRLGGLDTLRKIKEIDPGTIVIIMTAHATLNDAVQAVKDGAYDYLSKPVSSDDLRNLVEKALSAHTLIANIAASAPVLMEAGRKIIGNTSQMQKVFNIIYRLAKVETPVLIRGASGTGKELVARAIHFNSSRKDDKFVAINCSAIPENLFESELFGHEKGSFTGANDRKLGKFQYAEGGTLFLDEVGDMPQQMQVKILRVLQEKVFTPVGSNREIPTNLRIIAATNRPLEEMIKQGKFREDLFYRLNVVPILLPELAARKEDVTTLVHGFVRKFNQLHSKRISGISVDALNTLKRYDWPGNIRELENVIEHSFVLENSHLITLSSLPEAVLEATGVNLVELPIDSMVKAEDSLSTLSASNSTSSNLSSLAFDSEDLELDDDDIEIGSINSDNALNFNLEKELFEKEFIIKALKTFGGRINQTALHANIPKKTLLRKIEKYGIIARDYSI